MSQHKIPLTNLEREELLAYHLPVDGPSQLSDAFRNGMAWALSSLRNDAGSESNPDEAVYPVGGEHMPDEWEEVLVWCDRYKRWVPGHWFTHLGSKEVRWNVNGTTGPVSFIKQPRYWRKMPPGVIEKDKMSDTKDGGPAFPSSKDTRNHPQGMTLLDYYAGKALEGLVKDKDALHALNGGSEFSTRENIADACFGMADAMIKARAKWTT